MSSGNEKLEEEVPPPNKMNRKVTTNIVKGVHYTILYQQEKDYEKVNSPIVH